MGSGRELHYGTALALPGLVIVSALIPFAGLVPGMPPWAVLASVYACAVGLCAVLLRGRGARAALITSCVGVALGAGAFALLMSGLTALANTPGGDAIANTAATVAPFLSAGLLVVACVASLIRVQANRGWLAVAWVVAFVSPFAFAVPVWSLSSAAGNAGMDVVAFFFAPLAALLVWGFILAVEALGSSALGGAPNKRIEPTP